MGEEHTGQPNADRSATERPTVHYRRRLTVSEAAEELGISAEAVRSRVKRGTLRSTKEGATVYVLLPTVQTRPDNNQTKTERDRTSDQAEPKQDRADEQAALVKSLQEQVAYMREQLAEEREARRRADTIMAQLSQANAEQARTIRALEPPREEPQAPQSASEEPEGTSAGTSAGERETESSRPEARSWWRKWFSIE